MTVEVNVATGSIKITKQTVGGDADFPFTLQDSDGNFIRLIPNTLNNGDMTVAENLMPGDYTIEELLPEGWELTGADCGEVVNGRVQVTVTAGQETACTFTNTRQTGSLTIVKQTIGGDDAFQFDIAGSPTPSPSAFSLAGGEKRVYSGLPTGSYSVKESSIEGWAPVKAVCGGGAFNATGDGVEVTVGDGADVVCTFTNFRQVDERMEDVAKLFVNRRVNNLLNHGPDRSRIIRRLDQQQQGGAGPMGYAGEATSLGAGAETGAGEPIGSVASSLPGIGASGSIIATPRSGGGFAGLAASELLEQDLSASSSHLGHGFAGAGPETGGGHAGAVLPFGLSGNLADGVPVGRFQLSLSQMREAAHARDARKISDARAYSDALGLGGNPYGVAYDGLATSMTPDRIDVWAEGHYSRYDDNTGGYDRDGDFGILYVGADYSVTEWLLFGLLGQFDWTDEDVSQNDLTGSVDGWGWMIGPYMGLKLSDNVYFSARAAGGSSENDIDLTDDVVGFRDGSFDTDRWIASAELTGNWQRGAWRFTPSAEIAYGSEDQESFRNSLGQLVRSSEATIGQLTWGPEIAYRHVTAGGTVIEPLIALEGIWNFDDEGLRLSDGTPIGDSDVTGKVEGGLMVQTSGGLSWRATGNYYGIGEGDLDAYGGAIWLSVPLN